jgi:uncharacterized membrane protein YjgN (DUF898 family)
MSAIASPGASPPLGSSAFITDNLPRAHTVQRFRVQFTGSGSEYFRIWIVNTLLMLVTLGLYHPWARARKLRYFLSNTMVASHALGFHGDPRKMLRAHVLTMSLVLICAVAGYFSQPAGVAIALVMAALWPALSQASTRARLASTSWRGLRFGHTGSLKDAYAAYLAPMVATACLLALGLVLLPAILETANPGGLSGPVGQAASGALTCLGLAALLPYAYWRIKRYQHLHHAYAQLPTDFRARYRDVIKLFINTATVGTLSALVALAVGGLVFMLGLWAKPDSIHPSRPEQAFLQALPMWLGLLGLAQVIPLLYFGANSQNLAWNHTGNRWLRFKSDLGFVPLLKLSLKNWALVALTLGLYWPFAKVAMTRLKLQAICVHMRISPDLLVTQAQGPRQHRSEPVIAQRFNLGAGL